MAKRTAKEERISEDELAYHVTIVTQLKEAQAAANNWVLHLTRKYGLGPLDQVTEDGTIIRQTPSNA